MTSWPILSVTTFLPLVGALFIMMMGGEDAAVGGHADHVGTGVLALGVQPDSQSAEGQASQSERPCDEGNARGSPHTKMSRAPAVSRRKRGVDITPASRSSTCASVRAIVSTDAEHA